VFCHGIWADGSCFNKVIPALQADGHQVIAAQYGLDSLASDRPVGLRSQRASGMTGKPRVIEISDKLLNFVTNFVTTVPTSAYLC